jgi:hypothetical protein
MKTPTIGDIVLFDDSPSMLGPGDFSPRLSENSKIGLIISLEGENFTIFRDGKRHLVHESCCRLSRERKSDFFQRS